MLANFFDRITRVSLRFRWVTIVLALVILALGVVAMTQLNQELLPRIEFPQSIVVAQWPDAESSNEFLQTVTIPLETQLSGVDGVVNVESTTNTGFAFILVRYDFGLNQERILEAIETAAASAALPETAETDVLNFSLSDLPVVVASVSSGEISLAELKEVVETELQPQLVELEQVSEVQISGGQELPEAVVEETSDDEEVEDPGRLPFTVVQGARALGIEIEYAQEITVEMLAGLAEFENAADQVMLILDLIPAELLPYVQPEALSYLPVEYVETLGDPALIAELNEITAEFGGIGQYTVDEAVAALAPEEIVAEAEPTVEPTTEPEPTAEPEEVVVEQPVTEEVEVPAVEPVPLPETWIASAAAFNLAISTTNDITTEFIQPLIAAAPEQLAELTPAMWRALDPEVAALALAVAAADLEPELLAQLQAIQLASMGQEPEPIALPESWVALSASSGFPISTTADVPPDAFGLLSSVAPELLADLTPEIILGFPAQTLAAIPSDYVATLDDGLQQTIANIVVADARYTILSATDTVAASDEELGRLPDILIQGGQQFGVELEYAQDITPDFMRLLAGFGEPGLQILGLLTPDHLRLLQPEVIALLPAEFVATLDADLLAELDSLAAEFGGAGALTTAEAAEPVDPARLPDALIQIMASFEMELEYAYDITPDFMRLVSGFGDQSLQMLALFTADNLRVMQPEVIALLPAAFLDTLDADLRTELDTLAAEFGGAGALALAEAEAAAALSAGAPPLAGIWLEPGEGGGPTFETAADLLTASFDGGAAGLLNFLQANVEQAPQLIADLSPEVVQFLVENEADFLPNLLPVTLELMAPETLTFVLENYPDAFDAELTERLQGIAQGDIEVFIPEASITRTDGNPSVFVSLFKDGDANTVVVAHRVFDTFDAYMAENGNVEIDLVFEQATFIEDSIVGVSREGALGGVFAVVVILLFLSGHVGGRYKLSWRATLVTAVSIPLSVFTALLLMRWVPPTLGVWLQGLAESTENGALVFISRLFPTNVTLNIMTLSGLTVAIGRVVDDSIVVLENSYRFIQRGDDPKQAVITATKEVAIAIFSATATTVAVFLPLGLIGGIIGSFFLPFGLTVAYALGASFVVSITVVPALTYMLIRRQHIPEEKETSMQRWYTPLLKWALGNRAWTMVIATVIFVASLFLLGQLPQSFIPSLGEPTINVSIALPTGTQMAETDGQVAAFETAVQSLEGIEKIQTEIGSGGGFEAFFGGGNVSQNVANVTISVDDPEHLGPLTNDIRQDAVDIFGEDNVSVSAASQTGFSGFTLVLTGESQSALETMVTDVKNAIAEVDLDDDGIQDIVNVSSSIDSAVSGNGDNETILRVDGRPAISFTGELETQNTLGVTNEAKEKILALPGLPAGVEVTEGFDSQQQVEGFQSMVVGIAISIVIVYIIMALTFRSLIHPFTILFSLPFALVGAAIALFITNSVLGISAMIGFMMLVGVVVTNGIVLMELVKQLRSRGNSVYESLVEGGRTRLRPIWMTALAAVLALIPLAASQEAGAIIASELARAVMGGLLVSTALTLLVVPVMYSVTDQFWGWLASKLKTQPRD